MQQVNVDCFTSEVKFMLLLDPQLWPEESYELRSVSPSFHPSVFLFGSFLGIGSLVFSETQHGFRGPCIVVRERAGLFVPKKGKIGQK